MIPSKGMSGLDCRSHRHVPQVLPFPHPLPAESKSCQFYFQNISEVHFSLSQCHCPNTKHLDCGNNLTGFLSNPCPMWQPQRSFHNACLVVSLPCSQGLCLCHSHPSCPLLPLWPLSSGLSVPGMLSALSLGALYMLFPLPFSPHSPFPDFTLHLTCVFCSSGLRSNITSSGLSQMTSLKQSSLPCSPHSRSFLACQAVILFTWLTAISHYLVYLCGGMIFEVLITLFLHVSSLFLYMSYSDKKIRSYYTTM